MVFWVFGYGSLVWNPGFEYDEKLVGFIKNYRRVFDLGTFFYCSFHDAVHPSMAVYLMFCVLGGFVQLALITEVLRSNQLELALWKRLKGLFA